MLTSCFRHGTTDVVISVLASTHSCPSSHLSNSHALLASANVLQRQVYPSPPPCCWDLSRRNKSPLPDFRRIPLALGSIDECVFQKSASPVQTEWPNPMPNAWRLPHVGHLQLAAGSSAERLKVLEVNHTADKSGFDPPPFQSRRFPPLLSSLQERLRPRPRPRPLSVSQPHH